MSSEYSVSRKDKKVSKNAIISLCTGLISIAGFFLLFVISIISIGKLGTAGGFFGCIFWLLSVFGLLWEIAWYDEARTLPRFKKAGIVTNLIGISIGVFFFIL